MPYGITMQQFWQTVCLCYTCNLMSSASVLLPTGLGGQLVLSECIMLKQYVLCWRLGLVKLCICYAWETSAV